MLTHSLKTLAITACCILCALPEPACAQQKLHGAEIWWAVWHPIAALKVKQKLPFVLQVYDSLKKQGIPDRYESGGKLDAFRHTYAMAYLSQNVAIRKLKKLGIAHEKGNYRDFKRQGTENGERPDSLSCEMDLRNNLVGFSIGKEGAQNLKQRVLEAIAQGRCWYLKRNASGQYTDCDGQAIDTSPYKNQWFVPKCLIKTNE